MNTAMKTLTGILAILMSGASVAEAQETTRASAH